MKKFFSLVLALVMALSLTTVAWGAGTCEVDTADELLDWAANAASYDTLEIKANIDLAGKTWTPVTAKNVTINGNGYTISNMTVNSGSKAGFIGSITSGTVTINNLSFDKASVTTSGSYAGVVIGHCWYCDVTLNNVSVTNSVVKSTAAKGTALGGLVGMCNQFEHGKLTLNGCAVDNCEISGYHSIGGLVGSTKSDAPQNFDACVVTNNTYTATATGGLGASDYGTGASGYAVLTTAPGTTNTVANNTIEVADGYTVVQNTDGTYVLVVDAAGSSTAALFDLHKADALGTEIAGDIAYTVVAANKNETTGAGSLEYIKMDGKLFVKIASSKATIDDFYVTSANQKAALFYLKQIDSPADVSYAFAASEFTSIGVKCDQMNAAYLDYTANEVAFYVFTDPVTGAKTYFADGAVTTGAPYYNGAVLGTEYQLLVDGEIVKAKAFTTSPLNAHVWAPSAYDKTTPVKALCGICGAQANLYKDGKIPAGSVVDDVLVLGTPATNYNVVIASVGSYVPVVGGTTTGGTVTSADTFDAGIAMYVGMSVMAAAGSAVVIGKKRED